MNIPLRAKLWRLSSARLHPEANDFYFTLMRTGYEPTALIDIVPTRRLIYIAVPKAATSTIKSILADSDGRRRLSLKELHRRRVSKIAGPKDFSPAALHSFAIDKDWFRFSFVRNPYDRLVSCWSDKFKGKPLNKSNPFAKPYLQFRPEHRDREIGFAEFVGFACETARMRIDTHWNAQCDIVNMPGIKLDFVGKMESLSRDIETIAERLGVVRKPDCINKSDRGRWRDYYSAQLASDVYKGYECDFDAFKYERLVV